MTRLISMVSGKGGVGKTTLTANLGVALSQLGKEVVAIDANVTSANLALYLNMPATYPNTLHDLLKGQAKLEEVVYYHPSGLRFIPGSIALRDLEGLSMDNFDDMLLDLVGRTDLVLIDAAAGFGREAKAAIEASDEIIIVTNPEWSSVLSALKAARLAEEVGTIQTGIVLNRVTRSPIEVTQAEIESMIDNVPVIATIPEDQEVKNAVALRKPFVTYNPRSRASQEVKRLAAWLVGEEYEIYEMAGFLTKLRRWLFK